MSFNRWGSIVDGVDPVNTTDTKISDIRSDGVSIYTDIPDSGVSRWTLDSNDTSNGEAVDVWDSNNLAINGASTGASSIASYDTGEAYEFDGSNDYLESNNNLPSSVTGAGARTIGVWVKLTSTSFTNYWHPINYGIDGNVGEAFGFYIDSSGDLNFYGNGRDYNTGYSMDTNPHLIVAGYDGSTVNTWVDGSPTSTTGQSISLSTADSPLIVGARVSLDKNTPMVGDDPRVYDKMLSDTEVQNWYDTGLI